MSMTDVEKQKRNFSKVVITLMKGVVYQETDQALWQELIQHKMEIADYVEVMGLSFFVDESEGYAFLQYRSPAMEEEPLPRLVTRRQLSYPVSLLLALFRYKLAEFDAAGGDTRLVMSRDEVVDMVSTFLPAGVNQAKFVDKIDAHINKIVKLNFVRRIPGQENMLEVRRIIKAFVNAQWLSEMDQRLQEYRAHIQTSIQAHAASDRDTHEEVA